MRLNHDPATRSAARSVYDTVYPNEEWSPVGFDEAERYGTVHYRQAVAAIALVKVTILADDQQQLVLI